MKIKVQRREGIIFEPVPMHLSDNSNDTLDIPPDVYDAWVAWKAQGEVLQMLLANRCIRRQLEDEITDLKAERQSLWGKF